jgi:hypothetical protein
MAPRSASDSAPANQNNSSGMKRVSSESDFSEAENGPIKDYRDYRVRKSGLIGYVNRMKRSIDPSSFAML